MRYRIAVLFLAAIYSSSPGQAARILELCPMPSISHQIVFRAVMEELAKRGHEIITLTASEHLVPVHYKNKVFENITEIDVQKISYDFILNAVPSKDLKKQFGHPRDSLPLLKMLTIKLVDLQLSVPEMKAILENKGEHFDLIFVEGFAPSNYVAGARFKAPVIGIYSVSAMLADFDAVENPSYPILYADFCLMHVGKLDFCQRLDSIFTNLIQRYYNWVFSEQFNEEARKHYGADAPTVEEAQREMSMLFLNAHSILAGVRPVVPAVVYIGGSNLKPKEPSAKVPMQ